MTVAVLAAATMGGSTVQGQEPGAQQQILTFRSGVELVRVSVVVRDSRGRFVPGLSATDFVVQDAGRSPARLSLEPDTAAISMALLFDVSGSMEGRQVWAREVATEMLPWLDRATDETAVFTFDTQLDEVQPFTTGVSELPKRLASVTPFGATSLHDAIARTAEALGTREGRRRAVVVFTDGIDTASRMTPGEVSAIAAAIDVPVYIIGLVHGVDDPTLADTGKPSSLAGSLADLADWTGGRVIVVSSPTARGVAGRALVEELRQQYLLVFESSGQPGWHPLEVRVRDRRLVVQARSGYFSGRQRPISQ